MKKFFLSICLISSYVSASQADAPMVRVYLQGERAAIQQGPGRPEIIYTPTIRVPFNRSAAVMRDAAVAEARAFQEKMHHAQSNGKIRIVSKVNWNDPRVVLFAHGQTYPAFTEGTIELLPGQEKHSSLPLFELAVAEDDQSFAESVAVYFKECLRSLGNALFGDQ